MARHIRRAQPPTNPLKPKRGSISRNRRDPRRNPAARELVPGSGMTKQKKRTFKAPAHLTQHRAAARRSAPTPPHDDPSPTGRAPRHGAGIRPPAHRRGGIFRAPIYERDWRPSCIQNLADEAASCENGVPPHYTTYRSVINGAAPFRRKLPHEKPCCWSTYKIKYASLAWRRMGRSPPTRRTNNN